MENTESTSIQDNTYGIIEIIKLQNEYNLSVRDKMQIQVMRIKKPDISFEEIKKYAEEHKNSNSNDLKNESKK